MKIGVDTNTFPATKRVAAWRGLLCDTYAGLDCNVEDETFRAVIAGHHFGEHSITRDTSSGHFVDRSRTLINRDKIERIFFAFVLAGRAEMIQAGRETLVEPGLIAFNDSTRPFQTWSGKASDIIWLGVPKKFVADRVRGLEDMTARAFAPSRPVQRIAFDLLAGLDEAEGRNLPEREADTLLIQTLDLLALTAMTSMLASERDAELPSVKRFPRFC